MDAEEEQGAQKAFVRSWEWTTPVSCGALVGSKISYAAKYTFIYPSCIRKLFYAFKSHPRKETISMWMKKKVREQLKSKGTTIGWCS